MYIIKILTLMTTFTIIYVMQFVYNLFKMICIHKMLLKSTGTIKVYFKFYTEMYKNI